MNEPEVLLEGVVGSTAYGLTREGSDVDRLGVYLEPTTSFLGLEYPKHLTISTHEPDRTLHEVGKYCTLALQCNPTIFELLWLPNELIERSSLAGEQLLRLRDHFPSRRRVHDAYLGYAQSQFTRLANRQRFPDVPVNRIEKHARHLRRLLVQGFQLYSTGAFSVKVEQPETYFEFGRRVAAGELDLAQEELRYHEELFDRTPSPLPEEPDREGINDWLTRVRRQTLYRAG